MEYGVRVNGVREESVKKIEMGLGNVVLCIVV